MLDFIKKTKNKYFGDKAESRAVNAKKRVIVQAALAGLTVILTVVVLFVGSAAWYTNTVQTAGIVFEAAEWGFDGEILIGDQVYAKEADTELGTQTPIIASPGESGTIALQVTNKSDNLAAVSVAVSKLTLQPEMQKRMYFYIDKPVNRNEEVVAREYLSEADAHAYVVFGDGDLILTDEVYSDAQLKWEWVYDVLGYYVRGTLEGETVKVEEYLRPIEYDYDKATFDIVTDEEKNINYVLKTVDGKTTMKEFLVDVSKHDGYEGTINPNDEDVTGHFYPVEVDETGYGVYAYLCTYSEVELNITEDTQLGEAASAEEGKQYPVRVSVLAQKSKFNTGVANTAEDLKIKIESGDFDVIRLAKDMAVTESVKVESLRDIILDLNGYKLQLNSNAELVLNPGSSLIIQNGTVGGTQDGTPAANAFKVIGADLTLGNVTIENVTTAITAEETKLINSNIRIINSQMTSSATTVKFSEGRDSAPELTNLYIEKSTVTSTGSYAIDGKGMNIQLINSTINGGGDAVIYDQVDGKLTLTGCTIPVGMTLTSGSILILNSEVKGEILLDPATADSLELTTDTEKYTVEAASGSVELEDNTNEERTTYRVVPETAE